MVPLLAQERGELAVGERAGPVEVAQVIERGEALRERLELEIEAHVAAARGQALRQRPDHVTMQRIGQELREARKPLRSEDRVAVEELVAAVAGQRDLGRARDLAADHVFRKDPGIGLRLVEQRGKLRRDRRKFARLRGDDGVPRPEAIREQRGRSLSSNERSTLRMVKVLSGTVGCTSRRMASTIDESRPPLRSKPTGTSARNVRFTDWRSNSWISASRSAPDACRPVARGTDSKYGAISSLPSVNESQCPGGSFLTSR